MTEARGRRSSLVVRGFLLASVSFVALLGAVAVVIGLEARQEAEDLEVAESLEVRAEIQNVRALLVDAETGVRGFLLTGEEAFLEPYTRAREAVMPSIDRLQELVSDNATQRERAGFVRRAAERRLDLLVALMAETDESARQRALEIGKAVMDGIRLDLVRMETEEDRLLAERTSEAERTRRLLGIFIPVAGVVGLLGLIASVAFTTRITRQVIRITANAQRLAADEPLDDLRPRSDEIGALAEAIDDAARLLRARQDELRSAREFLEYLIDAGPVVMFRKDLASEELTYISPNVERVLGVRPDEAIGRQRFITGLLDGDHRPAFRNGVAAAARGEIEGWYGEYQTATDHGQRWVAVQTRVQPGADGTPAYLLGYVLDITDRVLAGEAARSAEAEYSALFDRIPTGMVTTAVGGAIVDANPAFASMLGYDSPDELVGEVTDIGSLYVDPADRRRFLDHATEQGRVTDFEVSMRRRDGTTIDIAINALLVHDDNGRPVGLEGTAIDVTARRRAETEARLARSEAERANQAKSLFLSRMSHELRTPLNSILGFSQLLEISEPALDDRSQESVSHILKAGRHLLDLINEVLDIAQVEAGALNLSVEPIRVDEVLAETVALMRPLAAAREIDLVVEEGCDDYVLADGQRLKQVLLNLLSNAVKYNRRGGSIRIHCVRTNGDLAVSVGDEGPGITAEQMARLFTPFDRLGAEDSDQQGTGLGLVLSRHLVEAMAGELSVESAPGEGSTFTVSLPVTRPVGEDSPGAAQAATAEDRSADRENRTVLYIEDNLANLRLIERVMALRPHVRLQAAMQGRLGIDLLREHRPDLVLLDLNLPDMSGKDVLVEIRANPDTRDIPVLVISADASPGQMRRLMDAGADGYLTKPVDVVELLAHVDRFAD